MADLRIAYTEEMVGYVSQSNYTVVTPTLASAYIAKNRKLTFRCAGGKTGAGTAKFTARLLPFAH